MSEPLTRHDLNDLVRALEENRDSALDRQTAAIKELFEAKMGTLQSTVLSLSNTLAKHVDDDRTEFTRVYAKIDPMQEALALTKLKVAGIIAGAGTVAGAVSAFIVKHLMSVVVYK